MTDTHDLTRVFKALSVDTRVRIIQLLKKRSLCVGALSDRLGVTQGAVSQHMRVLRETHLVTPEKRGYYVHYRLNEKAFAQWKVAAERFLDIDLKESQPRICALLRRKESAMCDNKDKCHKPKELKKDSSGKCSPEQIKKCHGNAKEHACTKRKK
jgi:DNA-binding transcriptional ArsR family regulator